MWCVCAYIYIYIYVNTCTFTHSCIKTWPVASSFMLSLVGLAPDENSRKSAVQSFSIANSVTSWLLRISTRGQTLGLQPLESCVIGPVIYAVCDIHEFVIFSWTSRTHFVVFMSSWSSAKYHTPKNPKITNSLTLKSRRPDQLLLQLLSNCKLPPTI